MMHGGGREGVIEIYSRGQIEIQVKLERFLKEEIEL